MQGGRRYLGTAISVVYASALFSCTRIEKGGEWRCYGSDPASTKYAAGDQINKSNIGRLQIAWRWASIDQPLLRADSTLWTWKNEATPIMVDGVLYTSTSMSQVAAIDAATGRTIWTYDPESYKQGTPPGGGFVHRGVAYWGSGNDRRVFIGTGDARLIALNAGTGRQIPAFGQAGQIDLTQGLRRPVDRTFYGVTSPPIICRDTVVVGSSILDIDGSVNIPFPGEMPPGDVRGFDVRSGKLRWLFESIPQGRNIGVETWEKDSWVHTGDTNVWSLMSCDEKLGYVYLPFGTASNDYYGGSRRGHNLFAESLVAINATTGQRVWHYQAVHHGLWDYDLPAAPNLVDITVNGRRIKAVAQVSKQAFVYVFDRVTGEPVWPIEERPVPQSTVAGEKTSDTQPFPTKPGPFDRQGLTRDDLIDFTPELRERALQIVKDHTYGPLFTPPSENGTIALPGAWGGASWAGAAVDPAKGVLFVPSISGPAILKVSAGSHSAYVYTGILQFGPDGPQGLPLVKPPYGRVTAIDLNTGEHLWMRPVGDGPRNHPALQHLNLPPLGWPYRSFVVLSKSLLFVAQEGPVSGLRGISPRGNAIELETKVQDPALLALDPNDGHLIAKIPLPGNATGTPLTFTARGKQYIVIPIGGASQPAELLALSLP